MLSEFISNHFVIHLHSFDFSLCNYRAYFSEFLRFDLPTKKTFVFLINATGSRADIKATGLCSFCLNLPLLLEVKKEKLIFKRKYSYIDFFLLRIIKTTYSYTMVAWTVSWAHNFRCRHWHGELRMTDDVWSKSQQKRLCDSNFVGIFTKWSFTISLSCAQSRQHHKVNDFLPTISNAR